MPVHRNEDVTRRLWTAVADGDSEALEDVLAPGVIWRSVGSNPLSGEYFGPSAVMEYMAKVGELANEFTSTLEEIYTNSNGAVALHRVQAKRGLRTLDMEYVIRLRIVDGQVVSALSVPVDQTANDEFWSDTTSS
jgi:ketosteroid isomerase-like protein